MSWGIPERGGHPWTKDEDFARQTIRAALEEGVNTFDTANVYSGGSSEEFTGRALREHAVREDYVLATKVHGRMRPGPNGAGLSRKAILQEIDASLTRLGTDYVDLYQIHRWDPETPIEETMQALHDVVRAGKARYIGASSMYAWQFAKAQHVAERHGWTRFVSMQDHYNLIYREEEREMLPLCLDQGVGVIPWSPLARGRLTRPWDTETARTESDEFGRRLFSDQDRTVVDDGARGRRAPWRSSGPGCARVADRAARGDLADRRDHEAGAPRRTPWRPSTWCSRTTRSRSSARATCRTPLPDTAEGSSPIRRRQPRRTNSLLVCGADSGCPTARAALSGESALHRWPKTPARMRCPLFIRTRRAAVGPASALLGGAGTVATWRGYMTNRPWQRASARTVHTCSTLVVIDDHTTFADLSCRASREPDLDCVGVANDLDAGLRLVGDFSPTWS